MSWDALDLALALHRAPGRSAELRARPLPEGITQLLRVALGRSGAIEAAQQISAQPAELLIEAAQFYVEQQMLARECEHDPWRVLGTAPGGGEQQLREHHHLLVRLVHPDRSDDWAEAYADRVNRAWRQLRDPESRDAARSIAAHSPEMADTHPDAWGRHADRGHSSSAAPFTTAPAATRRSRWHWSMAASLMLAIAAAGGWWLTQAESVDHVDAATMAPATADIPAVVATTAPPPEAVADAIVDAELAHIAPLPIDTLLPEAPTPAVVPEPRPEPVVAVAATPTVAAPAPRATARDVHRTPVRSKEATVPPAAEPEPRPASIASRSDAEPAPLPTSATAPLPEPAAAVVDVPQPPSDAETLHLLDRYGELYAAGDLSGILSLYARRVHNDHLQFAPLAAEFARVFDSTETRSLQIADLKWQRRNDRITGHARYQLRQQPKGSLWRHTERGRIEFELIRDGEQSRFLRLTSIAERRS